MVFFNYALRKLNAKIVYYGPGLCGKTTNLQWIHDHFEGGQRGKMLSLATEGDRTIFFDLLPLEIGTIRGMQVTLQLYTVPGQVHYNSTRQLVLRGADGVVFVADSQSTMATSNKDSLKNLEENLALQGVALKGFPSVLQFNKRDLSDVLTIDEMDEVLNAFSVPIFEAVATQGIGVQESLEGIVKLVMRNLRERYEPMAGTGAAPGTRPGMPAPPQAPAAAQPPPHTPPSTPPIQVPRKPVEPVVPPVTPPVTPPVSPPVTPPVEPPVAAEAPEMPTGAETIRLPPGVQPPGVDRIRKPEAPAEPEPVEVVPEPVLPAEDEIDVAAEPPEPEWTPEVRAPFEDEPQELVDLSAPPEPGPDSLSHGDVIGGDRAPDDTPTGVYGRPGGAAGDDEEPEELVIDSEYDEFFGEGIIDEDTGASVEILPDDSEPGGVFAAVEEDEDRIPTESGGDSPFADEVESEIAAFAEVQPVVPPPDLVDDAADDLPVAEPVEPEEPAADEYRDSIHAPGPFAPRTPEPEPFEEGEAVFPAEEPAAAAVEPPAYEPDPPTFDSIDDGDDEIYSDAGSPFLYEESADDAEPITSFPEVYPADEPSDAAIAAGPFEAAPPVEDIGPASLRFTEPEVEDPDAEGGPFASEGPPAEEEPEAEEPAFAAFDTPAPPTEEIPFDELPDVIRSSFEPEPFASADEPGDLEDIPEAEPVDEGDDGPFFEAAEYLEPDAPTEPNFEAIPAGVELEAIEERPFATPTPPEEPEEPAFEVIDEAAEVEEAVPEAEPFPEPEPEPAEPEPLEIDETPAIEPEILTEEPGAELAPVKAAAVKVQPGSENSLRVQLEGTGALAEYGQVREMDIVVPVPGEWVGNRRVTLQLRLTLEPTPEDADDGTGGSS